MAKRRNPSAIGLSMLDLISNALASIIILFIILSSIRVPSIPPERVKGTLLVRLELKESGNAQLESIVWVEPPNLGDERKRKFFGGEIYALNTHGKVFGPSADCGCNENNLGFSKNIAITPCIALYTHQDSANVHYLVIRDPVREEKNGQKKYDWGIGLLYVDHEKLIENRQPVLGKLESWFINDLSKDSLHFETFSLDASTNFHKIIIDLVGQNQQNH